MRIKAKITFTETTLSCVPVAPELSAYREDLALADGALEFRLRLFAARVKGDAPAPCVAVAIPQSCVLRELSGPMPFGNIPPEDLHIITTGDGPDAHRIAVERHVCDAAAAFLRAYGMVPAMIILPQDAPDPEVIIPLEGPRPGHDAADEIGASIAPGPKPRPNPSPSAIAMPPALQRELKKRQERLVRKTARAERRQARSTGVATAQNTVQDPMYSLSPFAPVPFLLDRPEMDIGPAIPAADAPACAIQTVAPKPVVPPRAAAKIAANQTSKPLRRKSAIIIFGALSSLCLLLAAATLWPTTRQAAMAEASSVIVVSSTSQAPDHTTDTARALAPTVEDRRLQQISLPHTDRLDPSTVMPSAGAGLTQESGPPRRAATFPPEPGLAQLMPPRIPGRVLNDRRSTGAFEIAHHSGPVASLQPITRIRPTATAAPQVVHESPAQATVQRGYSLPVFAPDMDGSPPATTADLSGTAGTLRPIARPISLLSARHNETAPAELSAPPHP